MKKLILFFSLILSGFTLKAQYNYSEWGVGAGASSVLSFSDLRKNDNRYSFNADIYYNYTPYMPYAFEIQAGRLSGGSEETDPSHRHFINTFVAASVHVDVQLGEIADYEHSDFVNFFKGLYIGLGAGLISNNIRDSDIRRFALNDPTYRFPGKNKSINLLIPLRIGYEIKIFDYNNLPSMAIDIGYVHNVIFGEDMDGYTDPSSKFKNNVPDMFRQITVGFKMNFGRPVAYTKPIRLW